jgi:alkaline phosphatase
MIDRRAFVLTAGGALPAAASPVVKLGLVTDIHYADKPHAGTRYYREAIAKMREAVGVFRDERVDFAVSLGDFVDSAEDLATETAWLKTMAAEFEPGAKERHFVLGNHCIWTLTKPQFLSTVGAKAGHYSFDRKGWHFVVLDACYRADGAPYGARNNDWKDTDIPAAQQEWLAADLAAVKTRAIVFVHQRLDVGGSYGVRTAPKVREILQDSGRIALVLQGHSHKYERNEINGIPYVTLAAMIEGSGPENNAYSVLDLHANGAYELRRFRNSSSNTARIITAPISAC